MLRDAYEIQGRQSGRNPVKSRAVFKKSAAFKVQVFRDLALRHDETGCIYTNQIQT